jgi:hypothetical protein
MTHTKDETLALALEALEIQAYNSGDEKYTQAITIIKQALAAQPAPVQEPVAWIFKPNSELLWPDEVERKNPFELNEYVPLYTTPPAAQPAVPEGWKLVPVEPTHGMVKAFQDAMSLEFGMRTTAGYHARVYSAMLTAAPEKGQP